MTGARVAYLLKKFPRLSETFVLNEILGQEARGTELHVFSRRPPDDEPRHPQLERLAAFVEELPARSQLDPWTELFAPPDDGPIDARDWLRLAELVQLFQEAGHPRFPRLVAEALFLRRRMRELDVSHVHVHFATDSAVTAMILRALGGPSYSVTAHAKDIYRSTVDARLLSAVVARSSFTVTVCDANVRHLQGMLSPDAAEKVRRLYNGIDLGAFDMQVAGREPAHVLGVGRLVEKKGFDVFVEACAMLVRQGVDFRATLIGDGDERERLERLVATRGLAGRIELTGPLAQDVVRETMRRATVLCLPCVVGTDGNRDALPTVLLEALAVGLPCVSTPVTGIPEILDDGRAGVLVPERDVHATANAVGSLLGDPAARERLARAGRARAEQLFDARMSAEVLGGWLGESARLACG